MVLGLTRSAPGLVAVAVPAIHTPVGLHPSDALPVEALPVPVQATPDVPSLSPVPPERLTAVLQCPVLLVESIPRLARPSVSFAMARACSSLGHLAVATKALLWKPPRGGRRTKLASVLIDRCRRWERGEVDQLLTEALARVRVPRSGGDVARHVATAERLAMKGQLTKAMRRLRPSVLAEFSPDTLARLEELHPSGQRPIPPLPQPAPETSFVVTHDTVLAALRSFVAGSAAGPSGLSPGHLLELCSLPGSTLLPHLVRLVTELLHGGHAGSFLFDARLLAFRKPSGGLRPIACGETIRRVAAKVALAQLKDDLRTVLIGAHQFGVAVPSGLEGIVHSFRRLANDSDSPDVAVVKVDFSNAFNRVERSEFIEAVDRHVPVLSAFVRAAYSTPSTLHFGDEGVISSTCGAQQGDPLGPALFSLACVQADHKLAEALGEAAERAWYLDDLTVRLPLRLLPALERALESLAPSGLVINRAKCSVMSRGLVPDSVLVGVPRGDLDNWDLLGTPIGSPVNLSTALQTKIDDVAVDLRTISEEFNDVQTAYTLLYYAVGFREYPTS
jgi:hypothetical protein